MLKMHGIFFIFCLRQYLIWDHLSQCKLTLYKWTPCIAILQLSIIYSKKAKEVKRNEFFRAIGASEY